MLHKWALSSSSMELLCDQPKILILAFMRSVRGDLKDALLYSR